LDNNYGGQTKVFKKSRLIIIGVVAAVIVLVAGVIGVVVVSAQSPSPSPSATSKTAPGKSFTDRVAGILGVDPAKVEAAFTQAEKDMANEAMKARLDVAVNAGKMTQDQADKYLQWWNSRPNVQLGPDSKMGPMMGGQGPRGGFHGMPGSGFVKPSPSATPKTSPSATAK
jgi:hypothetical protein